MRRCNLLRNNFFQLSSNFWHRILSSNFFFQIGTYFLMPSSNDITRKTFLEDIFRCQKLVVARDLFPTLHYPHILFLANMQANATNSSQAGDVDMSFTLPRDVITITLQPEDCQVLPVGCVLDLDISVFKAPLIYLRQLQKKNSKISQPL